MSTVEFLRDGESLALIDCVSDGTSGRRRTDSHHEMKSPTPNPTGLKSHVAAISAFPFSNDLQPEPPNLSALASRSPYPLTGCIRSSGRFLQGRFVDFGSWSRVLTVGSAPLM